jgi:hypothetical protein
MLDFDERDLIVFAEDAGFANIRLTLIAEVTEEPMRQTRDWEVFLNSSPNPLAPTLREARPIGANSLFAVRRVCRTPP